MTDLDEKQRLAESAKQVLDNEAFKIAVNSLNSTFIQSWLKTPPEAVDERERLFAQIFYGQNFVATIENMLKSYRSAEALDQTSTKQGEV